MFLNLQDKVNDLSISNLTFLYKLMLSLQIEYHIEKAIIKIPALLVRRSVEQSLNLEPTFSFKTDAIDIKNTHVGNSGVFTRSGLVIVSPNIADTPVSTPKETRYVESSMKGSVLMTLGTPFILSLLDIDWALWNPYFQLL